MTSIAAHGDAAGARSLPYGALVLGLTLLVALLLVVSIGLLVYEARRPRSDAPA